MDDYILIDFPRNLLSAYNVSNGDYTVIANLPNSIFQFRKFNNNFNNNNDFNKYNDH